MAEHESALAVLVDFENMARPGAKGRGDFDIHLVLNRLAEKGRVLVKRAYADWSRYRDARHELQNAGLGLIEMPSAREGAKNRADIQMAVDAMELAYSREHVDNFVIVSGDSDFTPLVGKLRELNKRVIGVGNRESASELLIANCDEFIFYDLLAARAASGAPTRRAGGSGLNPVQLLQETLTALQREGVEWPLASVVKDSMRRKYPAFDENEHGYSTFSKFLEEAGGTGIVRLETDPRSGTYRVELGEGRTDALPPVPAPAPAAAERTGDEPEGRRRRRRGGRRSEAAPQEEAGPAAEVFEVIVTPTPDVDLGALPPLDEPISYEDMIMLGPEVGEDVPELLETTDVPGDGPPSRSARRRRRRAAVAEPEPTVADLEPLDAGEIADVEAVVAAEGEPAAEAETSAADEAEGAARRRRRRRGGAAAPVEEAVAADAATAEAPADVAATGEAAEPTAGEAVAASSADEGPAEDAPASTGRRRVRRRSGAAEPEAVVAPDGAAADAAPPQEAAAEEAPAEEAPAPAPRRRTARKKTAPEAEPEAAAEEAPAEEAPAPAPRRRTARKKTAPEAEPEAEPEAAAEEAPAEEAPARAPRRRTARKKAAPAEVAEAAPEQEAATAEAGPETEAAAPAVEATPAPARRRTTRKKAEPAETA